jgi:hypothetical protein
MKCDFWDTQYGDGYWHFEMTITNRPTNPELKQGIKMRIHNAVEEAIIITLPPGCGILLEYIYNDSSNEWDVWEWEFIGPVVSSGKKFLLDVAIWERESRGNDEEGLKYPPQCYPTGCCSVGRISASSLTQEDISMQNILDPETPVYIQDAEK